MRLRELIEMADDPSKMQAKGATYKEYVSAMLKKCGVKSVMQMTPEQKKKLDAGWKAKDE